MATRATSSGARTLLKLTYSGGAPAFRNASRSSGSGRSSGRNQAPVCTTSKSGDPGHGPRSGSAASHGRSVKTWSRTLFTAGMPSDARCALSGPRYSASTRSASTSHSTRLSVSPCGNGLPGRGSGEWCGEGMGHGCSATRTYGMPFISAIVRSPAGIKPDATTASHPSAAGATVSNCIATKLAAVFGASAGVSGFSPCSMSRSDLPIGISGTPARSASSAKSGGAQTRTSTPSPRNATANPIIGSTSPREPHVDNNTRIRTTPSFLQFWLRPEILGHDRGLAASPPMRCMLKREEITPVRVRIGDGATPASGSAEDLAGLTLR